MQISVKTFEDIYDKYSPMLYGIALEISTSESEGEEILISTFQKVHSQNLIQSTNYSICGTLIKLLIQSAHEILNNNQGKINFKIKIFENTPLLHKLLCEQINFNDHCRDNSLSHAEAINQIRREFISLRKQQHQQPEIYELSPKSSK